MTRYDDGAYFRLNPSWHVDDSSWKVHKVADLLSRSGIRVESIADIGCGAGEVLRELVAMLPAVSFGVGYEPSPQAYAICSQLASQRLRFEQRSFPSKARDAFDVAMALDVVEHVENPWEFLRALRDVADYKVLHIPLDLSAQAVLRRRWLIRAKRDVGHIHYFCKETALGVLDDAGYEIIEASYAYPTVERPQSTTLSRIARVPRRAAAALNSDAIFRAIGGASLLVLAR